MKTYPRGFWAKVAKLSNIHPNNIKRAIKNGNEIALAAFNTLSHINKKKLTTGAGDWFTTRQVATRLNLSIETIRKRCNHLREPHYHKTMKKGYYWYIHKDELK